MIMGLSPVAIQAGTSAELPVQSRYSMDGTYRVIVGGAGVTGEVSDPHSVPMEFSKAARSRTPSRGRHSNR